MAYYLSSHGGPLSHCGTWCKSHVHFIGDTLNSQRISEILNTIGIGGKQTFFSRWMDKVLEEDYLCYDITSFSSYSELNEYIKYGHNRDKEKLPQMNLAILFGQKGRLPVYFQRTPGNITDVTTLHNSPYATWRVFRLKPKLPRLSDRKRGCIEQIHPLFRSFNPGALAQSKCTPCCVR